MADVDRCTSTICLIVTVLVPACFVSHEVPGEPPRADGGTTGVSLYVSMPYARVGVAEAEAIAEPVGCISEPGGERYPCSRAEMTLSPALRGSWTFVDIEFNGVRDRLRVDWSIYLTALDAPEDAVITLVRMKLFELPDGACVIVPLGIDYEGGARIGGLRGRDLRFGRCGVWAR